MLLFSHGDVRIQEFLVEHNNPTREVVEHVYELFAATGPPGTEFQLSSLVPRIGPRRKRHAAGRRYAVAGKSRIRGANDEFRGRRGAGRHGEHVGTPDRGATGALMRWWWTTSPCGGAGNTNWPKSAAWSGYANARQCRRQKILGYFGEAWHKENCNACDHCLHEKTASVTDNRPVRDLSEGEWLNIQKILSCVARMHGRYGRTRVVQVLQGSRARDIRNTHLAELSTYGILKGSPREMIDAYLEALIGAGCIDIVGDEYPKLQITDHGEAVMRRRQSVRLPLLPDGGATPRQAAASAAAPRPTDRRGSRRTIPSLTPDALSAADFQPATRVPEAEAGCDPVLLQRLQVLRRTLAEAESVPAYCIVQNRTLRELAQRLPTEPEALLQISGIGKEKARKYGDILLEEIRGYLAAGRMEEGQP